MASRDSWCARARPAHGHCGELRSESDPDALASYLSDAAHYPGGASPAIVFPTNEAEVAQVLRDTPRVLPIGSQSSLTGGATPHGDTLLSTARLTQISFDSSQARVEAGVVLRALLERLRDAGLYYPPTPTFDGASVGGTVGTNAAGAATFKYGTTRDWVHALCVVLANGDVLELERGQVRVRDDGVFAIELCDGRRIELHRPEIEMPDVPKCSAGYFSRPGMDLIDLFIGAEGTLGVVTQVTLELVHPRPQWFTAFVPLAEEHAAAALTADLRRASLETWQQGDLRGLEVAAIELLDRHCLDILRADGDFDRAGITVDVNATAALLVQAEVAPDLTAEEAAIQVASYEDPTVDAPLARLCRLIDAYGGFEAAVAALPGDESKRATLLALREAVPQAVNRRIGELKLASGGMIAKAANDVIVPFEHFSRALAAYREVIERHRLESAIWGHISDGNVHPNLLPRNVTEMASANRALLEIGQVAIDLGGAPMSEHGVGRNPIKKELLRRLYGDAGVESMRAVKRALDPEARLAVGVLFD